jgi:hypothetical protein
MCALDVVFSGPWGKIFIQKKKPTKNTTQVLVRNQNGLKYL